MSLPRMPEDNDILDMIRSGATTVPHLAHKIYGYPDSWNWQLAKGRVIQRLRNLEKYRFVRQTDRWIDLGNGVKAKIWEVVE